MGQSGFGLRSSQISQSSGIMKRYELLALVLLVSHAFSASVPEAELEEDEPVEGFDLSSDGAFGSQHQTRIQTDDFLLEHNSNFDLDHVFAESRVGPGPFQILVHDLDGQDDDAVVETVDERDIPDDTFSMGDTFEPISNAFDPLRDAVQPVTTAFNTPVGATVGAFAAGTKKLLNAKAILAAPFVKAGAFLAAPFVKVGAKKIALIMKGGVVVGAKLLKGAALKTKVAATKAGLGAALLGKKAVIFGSGAALKGGLATGLATAAGAPLVLVPAAAASAASKFFPQLNVPGLNNLGASIQDQLENFNLFNKATPEEVEDDQVVIMGETEDGQTILIPTPGNANAPTIVNLDADLGSGTNTVIVDADSLSSTHGRTGSRHHGRKTVEVDSKFLNKLLSQSFGGRTRQSGNY